MLFANPKGMTLVKYRKGMLLAEIWRRIDGEQ